MMKIMLAIAMFALIGFSLTSAAAADFGSNNNDVAPAEMEEFKTNLKNLLQQVSEQFKENADFKDASDVEHFLQENEIDIEQDSILSEEEDEITNVGLSDAEDDQSGENVESGISCRWSGLAGKCCHGVKIARHKLSICLGAKIMPPLHMRMELSINKKTIWAHTVTANGKYTVCHKFGPLHICIYIYNVHVTNHTAEACLKMQASFRRLRIKKRLGCFSRRFAAEEIPMDKNETPRRLLGKEEETEENNDLLFVQNNNEKPTSDVFTFQQ